MASIVTNIARIEVGGESLVSAAKANELIDAINALRNMQIVNGNNIGTVAVTKTQVFLDFTKLEQRLLDPTITASGTCANNNITINISLNI